MRKLILGAFTLLLCGGVIAQAGSNAEQTHVPGVVGGVEKVNKNEVTQTVQSFTRGAAFFTEDFANGFDGNNGLGAWDAQDSGGDTPIWMVATSASPAGQYSNTSQALQSTTAANGWIIYDTDLWNSPDIIGQTEGSLTSPSIDCSGRSSVVVAWEQRFRYCCSGAGFPVSLGVSNDGGTSWTYFEARGDFLGSGNDDSGNMDIAIDISCVAADEENVLISFTYNEEFINFSHYYWGIDDVSVYEVDAFNDLVVNQVMNGDVFSEWEYRVTPIQQAVIEDDGGLLVGMTYENAGVNDQTGVTLTAEVLDADGTVLSTVVSDPFDLPARSNSLVCPSREDTLYMQTEWVPEVIGNYDIRVTIASDQVQDAPEDDIMLKAIQYTDCVFGHDTQSNLDVELLPRDADAPNQYENTGYGSYYTVKNPGSVARGITVQFGPQTDVEFSAEVRIYTVEGGQSINDATFLSTFYDVSDDDVPPNSINAFEVYIPFDDEVDLEVFDPALGGPAYFVAIVNDEISASILSVMATDLSDTDNSTGRIAENSNNEFVWFQGEQQSPAVRLVIDEEECAAINSGVEELQALNVELGQNMPNPATGMTTIQFTMEESMDIDFQIVDQMGRVIYSQIMGKLSPGQHQIELDASNYAPGIYMYSLMSEGKRSTKSMVISK